MFRNLLTCVLLVSGSPLSCAVMADEPFVAAVDRFAAHDDISDIAAGRLLMSELSCTACHSTSSQGLMPKGGPRLNGAGLRLSHEWVRAFIRSPHSMKPGTTMPALLESLPADARDAAARALAAFVSSQREPFEVLKAGGASPVPLEFWTLGEPKRGEQLFHRIGCVACHDPDSDLEPSGAIKPGSLDRVLDQLTPEELLELGLSSAARRVNSIPLGTLSQKYSRRSLTMFLRDPHRTRPAGRMPRFQLSVVQAADIAEWLLSRESLKVVSEIGVMEDDPVLVAEGRRLFQNLGCANCHSVSEKLTVVRAPELARLESRQLSGCLVTDRDGPSAGLPAFHLTAAQSGFVLSALRTSAPLSPGEQLQHTLLKLNCLACHEREEQGKSLGGVGRYRRPWFETFGHVDLGDEGRLPPPLTGAGSKLRQDWLVKVFQGKALIRPHMRVQMPLFPQSQVSDLPRLLVGQDRTVPVPSDRSVFAENAPAEAGRQLLDTGCVQCHPVRGESLPGVMGTELTGVASRVTPDWFRKFLLAPGSMKRRTRMPTFFPKGRSQNPDLLDGDTERQIAAMWNYLKDSSQPLPPKIERARAATYELVPKDRPILLRTFMKKAGTHAIAVGYPEGVHLAFDAEQVRPAFMWRGRFLDARGTWFERFTPPAVPLGSGGIDLPSGPTVATLATDSQPWPTAATGGQETLPARLQFAGYRLNKQGTPVFLYRMAGLQITDQLIPFRDGFRRTVRVSGKWPRSVVYIRVLADRKPGTAENGNGRVVMKTAGGLKVSVSEKQSPVLRTSGELTEWLIPVTEVNTQIEVDYSW